MIQTKLTINQPGDIYEQEADRVAEQVMRMPDQARAGSGRSGPVIQRQTDTTPPAGASTDLDDPEAEVAATQRDSSQEIADTGQGVASIEAGLPFAYEERSEEDGTAKSAVQTSPVGRPSIPNRQPRPRSVLEELDSPSTLAPAQQRSMERFFGHSFEDVKVHTNARASALAASLGAEAFTFGNHIAFAEGRYRPEATEGKRLIAHELTHVIQQRKGLGEEILRRGIGTIGDQYEREANQNADELVGQQSRSGGPATRVAPATTRGLQGSPRPGSGASAIQTYSGVAAATYARTWAMSTNPTYGRFGNDCTNFVSQAMIAGGWKMDVGSSYCGARKNNDVWWFKKDGCDRQWPIPNVHASHTWGGAENFFHFTKVSGRGTPAKKVSELGVGDVLQADWDSNGNISHTMIATKSTTTNTYFTYHTSDHADEPFWPEGKNKGILGRNPSNVQGGKTTYYGWKM